MVSEVHNRTKSALRHNPFSIFFFLRARLRVALCARREESVFDLSSRPGFSRRAIGPRDQSLPRSGRLEMMVCAGRVIRGASIAAEL
jgi:hypothetical protein